MKKIDLTVKKCLLWLLVATIGFSSAYDNTDKNGFPPLPTIYKGPGIPKADRAKYAAGLADKINTAIYNANKNTAKVNEKDFDTVAVRVAPNGHDLSIAANVKQRITGPDGKPSYGNFGIQPNSHGPVIRRTLAQEAALKNSGVTILAAKDTGAGQALAAAGNKYGAAIQKYNDALQTNNRGLQKNTNNAQLAAKKTYAKAKQVAEGKNAAPHAEMVLLYPKGFSNKGGDIGISKPSCRNCARELARNKMNVADAMGTSSKTKDIKHWDHPAEINVVTKQTFPVHSSTGFGAGLIPGLNRKSNPATNPLKAPSTVAISGLTAGRGLAPARNQGGPFVDRDLKNTRRHSVVPLLSYNNQGGPSAGLGFKNQNRQSGSSSGVGGAKIAGRHSIATAAGAPVFKTTRHQHGSPQAGLQTRGRNVRNFRHHSMSGPSTGLGLKNTFRQSGPPGGITINTRRNSVSLAGTLSTGGSRRNSVSFSARSQMAASSGRRASIIG